MQHPHEKPNIVTAFLKQPPIAQYQFLDVVKVWLREPLKPSRLSEIATYSGGRPHLQNGCPFDSRYTQRVDLYQPQPTALGVLASFDEVLLNYVEIAFDLVLPDEMTAHRCVEFFKDHFAQPWHRASMQPAFYYKGPDLTGYSTRRSPRRGERRNGIWLVCYADRPCRVTNEPHCFHAEIRVQGVQALRRLGIHHPRDLVGFDFASFFAKHINLYEIDLERLGRYLHNRQSGTKRKSARIEAFGPISYNVDHRQGATVYRALSDTSDRSRPERSLQQFLDNFGSSGRRFLRPLSLMFMSPNLPHLNASKSA